MRAQMGQVCRLVSGSMVEIGELASRDDPYLQELEGEIYKVIYFSTITDNTFETLLFKTDPRGISRENTLLQFCNVY